MKKIFFVNIAIISNLSIFFLPIRTEFSIIPFIACLVGTKRLSDLYISHENKIGKKRRIQLYLLILLNYLSLIAIFLSNIYDLDTLSIYVANVLVTLYVTLLVFYIYTVTNIARYENNAKSNNSSGDRINRGNNNETSDKFYH